MNLTDSINAFSKSRFYHYFEFLRQPKTGGSNLISWQPCTQSTLHLENIFIRQSQTDEASYKLQLKIEIDFFKEETEHFVLQESFHSW